MTEGEEKLFFTIGDPPQYLKDFVLAELGSSIVFRDTKNGENRKVVLTKELTGFLKQAINLGYFSEHVFCHKNGQPLKFF